MVAKIREESDQRCTEQSMEEVGRKRIRQAGFRKIVYVVNNIVTGLRTFLFPREQDIEYQRWVSDGGDEVLRYDYDLNADSLVIDVGGYKGQWASDIYARYNCRIMVFEPVKSFAENIKTRFRRNPRVETFCFALGQSHRQETIALGDDGSSIFRTSTATETIQFEDVADFFVRKDIKVVDLMKINTEGGEYELLPRLLETGLVTRIKHIQIQFHDIDRDSEMRMEEICNELSSTHRRTYRYKFVWENWVHREI
jgi:FkbM family methyltransferase